GNEIVVGPATAERIRTQFVLESLGERRSRRGEQPKHLVDRSVRERRRRDIAAARPLRSRRQQPPNVCGHGLLARMMPRHRRKRLHVEDEVDRRALALTTGRSGS
ncbi:MAG: hypothetical protein HY216_09390, partial [Candidatus Rokubacteria bacterium]|nr:hypothetical protein [Candidatus Rokubacteria bacterium]